VDVFPYPPWMVAVAAILALALLGLVIWLIVSWIRNRPGPPPLGARSVALGELEKLRARAKELEPYAFSIAVSDVLRTFINNAKFRLPAKQQTSPEFLAAISSSALFSENDRALLTRFLEKCDMIKFARVQATSEDNTELVESALTFVQGGQA
jgi:thiol:disulfide interchange protein